MEFRRSSSKPSSPSRAPHVELGHALFNDWVYTTSASPVSEGVMQATSSKDKFRLQIFLEDRMVQKGPFLLLVNQPEKITVQALKWKAEKDWGIPRHLQKWIMGGRIAKDDTECVTDFYTTPGGIAFLCIMAPNIPQQVSTPVHSIEKRNRLVMGQQPSAQSQVSKPTVHLPYVPRHQYQFAQQPQWQISNSQPSPLMPQSNPQSPVIPQTIFHRLPAPQFPVSERRSQPVFPVTATGNESVGRLGPSMSGTQQQPPSNSHLEQGAHGPLINAVQSPTMISSPTVLGRGDAAKSNHYENVFVKRTQVPPLTPQSSIEMSTKSDGYAASAKPEAKAEMMTEGILKIAKLLSENPMTVNFLDMLSSRGESPGQTRTTGESHCLQPDMAEEPSIVPAAGASTSSGHHDSENPQQKTPLGKAISPPREFRNVQMQQQLYTAQSQVQTHIRDSDSVLEKVLTYDTADTREPTEPTFTETDNKTVPHKPPDFTFGEHFKTSLDIVLKSREVPAESGPILRLRGYGNGRDASSSLASNPPDLILPHASISDHGQESGSGSDSENESALESDDNSYSESTPETQFSARALPHENNQSSSEEAYTDASDDYLSETEQDVHGIEVFTSASVGESNSENLIAGNAASDPSVPSSSAATMKTESKETLPGLNNGEMENPDLNLTTHELRNLAPTQAPEKMDESASESESNESIEYNEQDPGVTDIIDLDQTPTTPTGEIHDDVVDDESDEDSPDDTVMERRAGALAEDYANLIQLIGDSGYVAPVEPFVCPICLMETEAKDGVVLRNCIHTFCRECIVGVVANTDSAQVPCPYIDQNYTCPSLLQEREIKAIVPAELFEKYLGRSMKLAELTSANSFHCQTKDCKGWCVLEGNVTAFPCPVCKKSNCIRCKAIHENEDCDQYQARMQASSVAILETETSVKMLQELIRKGEALDCPSCHVVLLKKWGCDWVRCSYCKTEICWITKGFRWGPNGKGDTSGGCKCGVNGVKCHPKCTYCH